MKTEYVIMYCNEREGHWKEYVRLEDTAEDVDKLLATMLDCAGTMATPNVKCFKTVEITTEVD